MGELSEAAVFTFSIFEGDSAKDLIKCLADSHCPATVRPDPSLQMANV